MFKRLMVYGLGLMCVAGLTLAADGPSGTATAAATPTAAKVSAATTPAPTAAPSTGKSLAEWYKDGGWVMYVLSLLSVFGLAITLERLFFLRRGVIAPHGLVQKAKDLWKQGKYEEIVRVAEASNSTVGRVIAFVVEHRDAPLADVSAGAGDIALAENKQAMAKIYMLAVTAMSAPLVGLLGTVGAMIESFKQVVNAGKLGSAAELYASISTALTATQGGLIVAIPALFIYHAFRVRTQRIGAVVDEEITSVLNDWMIKKTETRAGSVESQSRRS
jgi:biopolymer transport protein ExbB